MVTGNDRNKFGATLSTGTHELMAGVNASLGGDDLAASPHELLEAALAACTVITVRMYAERKQIPLKNTHVQVKIVREVPGEATIAREVRFEGELSAEQRQRLLEIANKCPLHKLLTGKIDIDTKEVP